MMDDSLWCSEGECVECDRARGRALMSNNLSAPTPKPPATSDHLTPNQIREKFGRSVDRILGGSGENHWDRIAMDPGPAGSTYTCSWGVWCDLRTYRPALASVEKTTLSWRLVMFTRKGPKFVVAVPEDELPGAGNGIYCDDSPFSMMDRDNCIEQAEMWMARAEKLK